MLSSLCNYLHLPSTCSLFLLLLVLFAISISFVTYLSSLLLYFSHRVPPLLFYLVPSPSSIHTSSAAFFLIPFQFIFASIFLKGLFIFIVVILLSDFFCNVQLSLGYSIINIAIVLYTISFVIWLSFGVFWLISSIISLILCLSLPVSVLLFLNIFFSYLFLIFIFDFTFSFHHHVLLLWVS